MGVAPHPARRTSLHGRHVSAGARLISFAGWDMPVSYEGIRAEHIAVRTAAGIFDVSHMGQIETRGRGAQALLQRVLSNDVARLAVGAAQYSVICRDDGGVVDDVITYRLEDDVFLTVTNAARHETDLAWFRSHARTFDAAVEDRREQYAMLALQGPQARGVLAGLTGDELPARMRASRMTVAGVADVLVCGTGYTGEDGVELLLGPEHAVAVWDAAVAGGAVPAGLGARDTLRLEAGFHLYGNDLSEDRCPIEAGLGWCCAESTGFVGAEAVAETRRRGPVERLVCFSLDGGGIPRQGNRVLGGGEVTSGTLSPCLGVGIGMAYVPAEAAAEGSRLVIDVRGRQREALVRRRPLYSRQGEGS